MDKQTLARSSPAGFAWYASDGAWLPAEHLLLLSEKLVDVAAGRTTRLMVFMPPRHGKSELISRYFPAWFLGRFPDRKVMLTSYADGFAASWGRRARDELEFHGPKLFGVAVDSEASGGGQWEVKGREGIMVTAGVGGGLTGKGAHVLIIDDPIKNAEDAASLTIRDKQHDWWKSTARTRLQKGGAVVLVMTRWHEDDLAGRLLKDQVDEGGDEWEILCLPALAEATPQASYPSARHISLPPDPLRRPDGAPLWPEMFDLASLAQTASAQGPYWFSAMYQQRPSPAEGMLFQRQNFRYFERTPDPLIVRIFTDSGERVFDLGYGFKFSVIDAAQTEKASSDYTVVATFVVTPERDMLLIARERVQFQGPDVSALARLVFTEQRPSLMLIENKSYGITLIQELAREGLPIVPVQADTDKVSRALVACARYEEHRVYHGRGPGYDWVAEEWEPELLSFPNAAHDDQVDTVGYAARQLPFLGAVGGQAGRIRQKSRGRTITGGLLSEQL